MEVVPAHFSGNLDTVFLSVLAVNAFICFARGILGREAWAARSMSVTCEHSHRMELAKLRGL